MKHEQTTEQQIPLAKKGDRNAIESVVRAVQPDVYGMALRFFWHPQDAEDASQEILIRVIKGLDRFRGDSSFRTWVHRIAGNTLMSMGKKRMEMQPMTFEAFGDDLHRGLTDDPLKVESDIDQALLLEEVKIGCTLAMLMCLNRDHRLAYILGEIIELEHGEAADVLEISTQAYRKRLSRSRADISRFMLARCGLVNPSNKCRCRRRVNPAVALGRVDPDNLLFASSRKVAQAFPQVLMQIRQLEDTRRAAALYKSHPVQSPSVHFSKWLRGYLNEHLDD